MQSLAALFEAVQAGCDRAVWSRGVELARADAVQVEARDRREIVLRIVGRAGRVAPQVTLHLEDEAWECSCASADDPCEHVAAAVIALRQEQKTGESLQARSRRMGRLAYRLREQGARCCSSARSSSRVASRRSRPGSPPSQPAAARDPSS